MLVEELGAEEALATLVAPELVVCAVTPLVLDEVRPPTEALPAVQTLERLHAAVGEDVRLQLVRPIEGFRTTCNRERIALSVKL